MTLDGILDQCRRFGLDRKETASVEALYKMHRENYLDAHVTSKTNAYDAIVILTEARARATKEAHQYMASMIDDIQRGERR